MKTLTKDDKLEIYNLLKTFSSCCTGYTPSYFFSDVEFEDDVEVVREYLVKPEKIIQDSGNKNTEPQKTDAKIPQKKKYAENSPASSESLNKIQSPDKNIQQKNFKPIVRSETNSASPAQTNSQQAPVTPQTKLQNLANRLSSCNFCPLWQTRRTPVTGEGVTQPLVLVIGDKPGEAEEQIGKPFSGPQEELLTKMLSAISLNKNTNCYITNIIKCHTPNARPAYVQEAEACYGWLQNQIHILKPRMILCMGQTAIQTILKTNDGLNVLRRQFYDYCGIPVLPTFSAYDLLRRPDLKREAWNDLKAFRLKLLEFAPGYEGNR